MKREKDTRLKNMQRDALNLLGRLENQNQEKSRIYQKAKVQDVKNLGKVSLKLSHYLPNYPSQTL